PPLCRLCDAAMFHLRCPPPFLSLHLAPPPLSTLSLHDALPISTSRATRVTSDANEFNWSTIVLMVFFSSRISPCASAVIFLLRSPVAITGETSTMLHTSDARLFAIRFTLSVRSFQVPATPLTVA